MQSPYSPGAGAAAASPYGGSPARGTKRDATSKVMQSPYGPPDPGAGGASSPCGSSETVAPVNSTNGNQKPMAAEIFEDLDHGGPRNSGLL